MPYNPTEPQNGEVVDADFLRDQFAALKTLTDQKLSTETDPVFAASEAHLFVPGDKAKLDSLQPAPQPKVFRALLSQTGSADPTLQVIANELGVNPTATRDSAGTYLIHLPGAFAGMSYGNVVGRPVAYMNTVAHEPRFLYVAAESDDVLLVVQYRSDGTTVDGVASNGSGILIEALVYG